MSGVLIFYLCLYYKHTTMKTLVIHPQDESTDFLKQIYEPIEDKLVVTGGKTEQELTTLIESHDRILMLGHGTPYGLLNWGQGKWKVNHPYLINRTHAPILKEKDCIFIWCNADEFVVRNKLNGFFSGMFISEVQEAVVEKVVATQDEVDESNYTFSELMSEHINKPTKEVFKRVKEMYGQFSIKNPVVSYNSERLYYEKQP